MRKIIAFIYFFTLAFIILGQDSSLKVIKLDNRYTWRTTTCSIFDSIYFNLPVIENTKFTTYIRVSSDGQIVDLFSNDNLIFQGTVTNRITKYKTVKTEWGKSNVESQYFYRTQQLDTNTSTRLANYLLNSGLDTIPTDSLIPSWTKGFFDCSGLNYQIKNKGVFSIKIFRCPWGQNDTSDYKKVVISDYEFIEKNLDLNNRYELFMDLLPPGIYSNDGFIMTIIGKYIKKSKKDL